MHTVRYKILHNKGQVLPGNLNPFFINRLTHTQKVESLARSVGGEIGLNTHQIETVAKGHDDSHYPFGHPPEDVIREEIEPDKNKYDFVIDHNRQNVRYYTKTADHPKHYRSSNVTKFLLNDLDKHNNDLSMEGRMVDVCDQGTYRPHDTDEGLSIISPYTKQPMIDINELKELSIISQIDLESENIESELKQWFRTHLMSTIRGKLHLVERKPFEEVKRLSKEVVRLSDADQEMFDELGEFLYEKYYYHPEAVSYTHLTLPTTPYV